MTRLGYDLGFKFSCQKWPKLLVTFWAISKNVTSIVKTFLASLWATFAKIGLLFISTSGHTGSELKR